jgi:hypothetical protein
MEQFNFEKLTEERRNSLARTVRPISGPELKALGDELFKHIDDPWRDAYLEFIDSNPGASFYHATTSDGVHLLYCRDRDRGIWFLPGQGKGPLQESGRRTMKELIDGSR